MPNKEVMNRRDVQQFPSLPSVIEPLEARQLFAYDLAITAISTAAASVTLGNSLSGLVTVTNVGDTPSPSGSVYFALTRVNVDEKSDGTGPEVVGRVSRLDLSPVNPGETRDVSLQLPIPTGLAKGQYYFSAVASERTAPIDDPNADIDFGLSDPNEDNNDTSTAGKISVVAPVAAVGKVDSAFGTGGTSTSVVPQKLSIAETIYVSETSTQFSLITGPTTAGPQIGLLRFNSDGSIDTTFGNGPGGVQGFPAAPPSFAKSLTRLDDDSLLITGITTRGDVVLVRLGLDGNPIPEFGSNGVIIVGREQFQGLTAYDVQQVVTGPEHSAFLIGTSGPVNQRRITLVKVTGNGNVDPHFGQQGIVYLDAPESELTRAATLMSDGRILIAGSRRSLTSTSSLAIVLTPQGALDPKFGNNGRVQLTGRTSSFESFTSCAEATDGSILLGGLSRTSADSISQAMLVRLKFDGKPDIKFNKTGIVTFSTGTPFEAVASVIPTSDGGALLSIRTANSLDGATSGQTGAALARFLSTGVLLSTYGTNGILVVTPAPVSTAADSDTDFDSYATSSDAEAEDVGGGKIRITATTSTDTSTTLTSTQLVADGIDLSASTTAAVSGAVLIGKSSSMKISLSNLGTLSSSGKATVTVWLLTDPDATSGISATATTQTIKLSPGSSKAVTLKFKFPTVTTKRGYYIAADVTAPSGQTDIDSTNNRASAAGLVTVGSAFTSIKFNLAQPIALPAAGKSGTFKVTASNSGNVNATGASAAHLFLSSSPTTIDGATDLGTLSFKGMVKAGSSATLSLKGTIPAGVTVPSGQYLIIQFSGALVTLDDDLTDNSAATSSTVS